MQRPTHPRLHVRHVYDAQTILEAVRLGRLRIVSRRLNDAERDEFIRSGSVFVWEESEEESGLRRWTDGRSFGQSRMSMSLGFLSFSVFLLTVNSCRRRLLVLRRED